MLLIIPMIIPEIVVFLVWGFVFNTQTGILNTLLATIGLESWQQAWLSQSGTALWAVIFIGFPFVASVPFLIFTSSLQGMPREVLEAALLDGSTTFRRVLHIDLPLMRGPSSASFLKARNRTADLASTPLFWNSAIVSDEIGRSARELPE